MADKHNEFVDDRGIKAMNKRGDCGWIMDLNVMNVQSFCVLNKSISDKFPKDRKLRGARLPDIVYLSDEGKSRIKDATFQDDSVRFITSEPDQHCFLLECHDSVQYVVDEKLVFILQKDWFSF